MKAIMMTVRLWWFYLTYKGIKKAEIRKRFAKNFKGKIYECVSKTNWKKDLMKIPEEEREFFKQFVGKVGLCFECDKVDKVHLRFEKYCAGELSQDGLLKYACLTEQELDNYLWSNICCGYAIHITKLEIFDKPKEISEFKIDITNKVKWAKDQTKLICKYRRLKPLTCAPQSYCYIEIE